MLIPFLYLQLATPVHLAQLGIREAGNGVSTKQWKLLAPSFADISFSVSNVMSRQGVKERTTQTVHTVRQGENDADNAVSTKQWRLK